VRSRLGNCSEFCFKESRPPPPTSRNIGVRRGPRLGRVFELNCYVSRDSSDEQSDHTQELRKFEQKHEALQCLKTWWPWTESNRDASLFRGKEQLEIRSEDTN
jgi:hypothetical protein